jgi:hypothetical protein
MQKIILALAMLLLTGLQGIAQCDKKVTWHATKADLIDANGTLLQTKEATLTLETDSQKVILSVKESPEDGMEGVVKEKTCDWKEAFKNGKTVYHMTLNNSGGKNSKAVFTVEAKDGKITILAEIEMMEGKKLLIYIDTYEEVK